jgi:hypothetical protein
MGDVRPIINHLSKNVLWTHLTETVPTFDWRDVIAALIVEFAQLLGNRPRECILPTPAAFAPVTANPNPK